MKVQIQQAPAPSQQPGARQRPLILVVDDEPDILFVMKKRMQLSGYDVATASDGEMALERIREFRPDLVMLDLKMPRLNGYQVCKAVRADPDLSRTLILVCSGSNSLGLSLENHCLLIGADGYVRKPYDVKKLLQEISRLLAQRKAVGVQGTQGGYRGR
jgi:CheY-like chemotaxis protein